jgi:serine protease Do
MLKRTLCRLALGIGLLSLPCQAHEEAPTAQDMSLLKATSKAFAWVAKNAIPAVVSLKIETTIEQQSPMPSSGVRGPADAHDPYAEEFFRQFFGTSPGGRNIPAVGQGSGFLVSADGYILTNNHIVSGAERITATLTDGREFQADIVGADAKSDVAVIKIKASDLPYLQLGNSDEIAVGEWVVAIGAPFGLEATVTVGVVSGKQRNQLGITDSDDFIQTDAAINPGNSGGPLLDLNGKVIGINTAILTRSGGNLGVGLAIPSNMAQRVMEQLISHGQVTRGFLGLSLQAVDSNLSKAFGLDKPQGGLVTDVLLNSPAAEAGIEPGDVILKLNGKPVESIGGLRNAISMMKPGQVADLTINRNGETMEKKVTIGTHPSSVSGGVLQKLGLEATPLTDALRKQLGYDADQQGVVIVNVTANSAAAKAGLTTGTLITQVNRDPVTTPAELAQAIETLHKAGDHIYLVIRQGPYPHASPRYVPITPTN